MAPLGESTVDEQALAATVASTADLPDDPGSRGEDGGGGSSGTPPGDEPAGAGNLAGGSGSTAGAASSAAPAAGTGENAGSSGAEPGEGSAAAAGSSAANATGGLAAYLAQQPGSSGTATQTVAHTAAASAAPTTSVLGQPRRVQTTPTGTTSTAARQVEGSTALPVTITPATPQPAALVLPSPSGAAAPRAAGVSAGAPSTPASVAPQVGGNSLSLSQPRSPGGVVTAQGTFIDPPEGTPLTDAVVATFTDSYPYSQQSDFQATIDWADGSTSAGFVVATGPTTFEVKGSHTYQEEGTYPTSVTIRDVLDNDAAVAGGTVVVDEAPLVLNGSQVSAWAGQPFTAVVGS